MNLREYLFRKRIKQNEFAKDSGVSLPTISRVLRGEDLKMSIAKRIVDASKGQISYEDIAQEIKEVQD